MVFKRAGRHGKSKRIKTSLITEGAAPGGGYKTLSSAFDRSVALVELSDAQRIAP